ncbi:MAG: signal peptidase I [Candidatus Kariarchaeaceae archaeon]
MALTIKKKIKIGIITFVILFSIYFRINYSFAVLEKASSMEPTYQEGDLFIISKKTTNIKIGDLVAYSSWATYGEEVLIIHRVIDKIRINETNYYRVKGDNWNETPVPDKVMGEEDTTMIPEEKIEGVVRMFIAGGEKILEIREKWVAVIIIVGAVTISLPIGIAKIKEKKEKITIKNERINQIRKRWRKVRRGTKIGIIAGLIITTTIIVPGIKLMIEDYKVGVVSGEVDEIEYYETSKGNWTFIQIRVQVRNEKEWYISCKEIVVKAYYEVEGEERKVSETRWKSGRKIEGLFEIGLSVIIEHEDLGEEKESYLIRFDIISYVKRIGITKKEKIEIEEMVDLKPYQ